MCLGCGISHYISAHSSEFSKILDVPVASTNVPEIVFLLLVFVGVCSGGWCSYFLLPIFMMDGGEVGARTTKKRNEQKGQINATTP